MSNTPFKMKGWSPFTKKSPAKDDPHTTTEPPHPPPATEEVDPDAYEKSLIKEQEEGKALSESKKRLIANYRARRFKGAAQGAIEGAITSGAGSVVNPTKTEE